MRAAPVAAGRSAVTVAARTMALVAALLSMLVASGDVAAAGEDCSAAGEAQAMSRLERTIAWMVSEETDYCQGVKAVAADAAAAKGFLDGCSALDADSAKRKYVHLTWYWADQVRRESCRE